MTETLAKLHQMKKRRADRRRRQRGITLLEILIVLAIIGLVMALLVGPAVMKAFGSSKTKVARIAVRKFAYEAYPQWSTQHKGCPASLQDLTPFMNSDDIKDPWGNPYVMQCGDSAPAGAKGFAVVSYGADGKQGGSGDDADINSWQVDEDNN
jgi:general secretion pathway protein G